MGEPDQAILRIPRRMNISQFRNIQRFFLRVAFVIFGFCIAELPALFGVLDYRALIGPFHVWWAPNKADPELLAVHRPHAHQSGTALGGDISTSYQIPPSDMTRFQWDVTYDHNGFRNQLDLKSADTVVIGDSMVEGLTVRNAELMTSHLAQLEGEVVANLGHSTYGPLQELVVLKRYGLPLHPRTVIWLFFEGNDLQDVISYQNARQHPPTFWHAFWERSFTRSVYQSVKRSFLPAEKPPGIKRRCFPGFERPAAYALFWLSVQAPFLGGARSTRRDSSHSRRCIQTCARLRESA